MTDTKLLGLLRAGATYLLATSFPGPVNQMALDMSKVIVDEFFADPKMIVPFLASLIRISAKDYKAQAIAILEQLLNEVKQ